MTSDPGQEFTGDTLVEIHDRSSQNVGDNNLNWTRGMKVPNDQNLHVAEPNHGAALSCDATSSTNKDQNNLNWTRGMKVPNDQNLHVAEPNHGAALSCDATSSTNKDQRKILRGLLSQQPMLNETCDYLAVPLFERRFNGIVQLLDTCTSDITEFSHRPRCQSVDANLFSLKLASARTQSRDSLVDSLCDTSESRGGIGHLPTQTQYADSQIEAARSKLMTLTTNNNDLDMDLAYSAYSGSVRSSSSQPGSPPHTDLMGADQMYDHRKLSLGSQLKARLQALRMGFRTPVTHQQQLGVGKYASSLQPVDLTTMVARRRRKFDGIVGLPYGRNTSSTTLNRSVDEGIGDDSGSDGSSSILKSILTGRERSNTISVCGLRSGVDPVSDFDSRKFYRQPVTLAKKNLHPVLAKISECLTRISAFTRSLSDFADRPTLDQRTLMAAALPRLLLLCMAESNIHFVVAPVLQLNKMEEFIEENKDVDESGSSALSVGGFGRRGNGIERLERGSSEMPTLQFAEGVKSFISKCQSLAISEQEYHLMRVIALFQAAGAVTVTNETVEIADRANAAARRDLQRLIEQTHSDDPILRYSALLMTFHTLFSINSAMLESLFCQPLATRMANGAELFFRHLLEAKNTVSSSNCSEVHSCIDCRQAYLLCYAYFKTQMFYAILITSFVFDPLPNAKPSISEFLVVSLIGTNLQNLNLFFESFL